MTNFPDGLDQRHLGDVRATRHWDYLPLLVLGSIVGLALTGKLGGAPPGLQTVTAPAATLDVRIPRTLRNGVIFEGAIGFTARRPLRDATIALSASLLRDLTINTTMPQAANEDYRGGQFRFHFGPVATGERLAFKFDGQVNPSLHGTVGGEVSLLDGNTEIAAQPVTMKVLP